MDDLRQIEKLLGIEREEEMSTAQIYEILCQIALALLIIFMMINVLFTTKAKRELEAAKGNLGVLQGQIDEYRKTPKGKIIGARDKALIDLQKQKLLLALEKVEFDERLSFGISVFTRKNVKGKIEYLLDDILSEGKVISERFKKTCILAKEILPNRKKMQNEWLSRICLMKGMRLSDSPVEESIVEDPELITKDNAEWLFQEINNRITVIYADCYDMQCMALFYLVDYYGDHIDKLMDTELGKQLDKVFAAPLEDRARLISDFSRELYGYVKSLFETQEIPLLSGV